MYTENIVRQLLITLKKDFKEYGRNLKGIWSDQLEKDFGALDDAKKQLAKCEQEESQAAEAVKQAEQKVEEFRKNVDDLAQNLESARKDVDANPKNNQAKKEVDKLARELQAAHDQMEKDEKLAEDARQPAKDAAKQVDDARKACQKAENQVGASQPYKTSRDWLTHKSEAAIRTINWALRSRQSVEIVKSDLNILHKEIRARALYFLSHVRGFNYASQDGIKLAEQRFESISQNLYLLNTISDSTLPQQGFLRIYFAAERAVMRFQQLSIVFTQWTGHFGSYFQGRQNLIRIGVTINSLKTRSLKVQQTAYSAAASCEIDFHRQSYIELCSELTSLYEEHSEIVCLLGHLQASPDLQPTFLNRVYRQLNRAGYFIAQSLSALKSISLTEKSRATQLVEAWAVLAAETRAIAQNPAALYAGSQPCAQPNSCQPQIQKIAFYAQEGLNHAIAYQRDPGCQVAFKGQSEAVNNLEMTLGKLRGKGLRPRIFDKLWWPIAQIHLILSRCYEEEEKCLVTDKQLDRFAESLKTFLTGLNCNTRQIQTVCETHNPAAMATQPEYSGRITAGGYISHAAQCAEQFRQSAQLALAIKPLVPEGLKPQLEEIIKQEESWRQAEQTSQGFSSAAQVKQLSRRLDSANATLRAAYTAALDNATGAEKQQLKALGEQLLLPGSEGQQIPGYQIAASAGTPAYDAATKAKGGIAL